MTTGKKFPQVFIGDGVNGSGTTLQGITKGDLFLINSIGGAIITTTAAAEALTENDTVQLAMGTDTGKALLSQPIKGSLVKSFIGNKYDAPAQEVTYIGYNGTSGTLPTDVSTDFRMRLRFKGANVLTTRGPWFSDVIVQSGATSSEKALAYQLTDAFAWDQDASKYVKIERISDGTKAAVGTGTTSFTFTKGSKAVICDGTINDATGGTALAVGASIVIGVSGNTDAVYIIAELDTTNNVMVLDTVYVGETDTYLSTELKQVSVANTTAASYGLKITGLEIEDLLEDYDQYLMSNFEAMFCEVGTEGAGDSAALITYSIDPFAGNGYYRQVAADEREAQTFRGWHAKTKYYHKKPESFVNSAVGYDSITIEFDTATEGDFGRTRLTPVSAKMYIPTGTAQSDEDTANTTASILNGYFSTVLGFTALNLDS